MLRSDSETQYKRQFGIWSLKRALSTTKKEKITAALETRAQQGKLSVARHQGKVEIQKIRRYMKEQTRRDISIRTSISSEPVDVENLFGHALQCGNRVDIQVATPSSNSGPSPRDRPSPGDALSPNNERSALTVAATENLKIRRAHLFAQKHHTDLLRGMNLQEQSTTTDWLNQFWQYSFITARTWGRGPRVWNASSLRFNEFSKARIESHSGTPAMAVNSSEQHSSHEGKSPNSFNIEEPSPLCRWSIHIHEIGYDRVVSPEPAEDMANPDDENSWRPWAEVGTIHDFAQRLQENLESNDFSTVEIRDLPLSSGQIARAAKRSPEQLMEDAFGFSIMARNRDLVSDMMDGIDGGAHFSLHDLYPLHLASSYLDGSKTCCGVFNDIVEGMPSGEASVRKLYTNHLNHTVLDNLMIAILKGHTSCTPVMVDEAFKKERLFAGEEVDICGRWDADSDCIRHLHASGNPTIPQNWKHMFCHTSAQAITHCIGTLFSPHWGPDINTSSGLFLKRCHKEECGLKLQLKPLHTLVVTTVYLAQLGSDGENLFGMIACLLCLLGKGANPLLKANVSLNALLNNDDSPKCSHFELDPLELTQKVPQKLISEWPQERITGWRTFCAILKLSQNEWNPPPRPEPPAMAPNGNNEEDEDRDEDMDEDYDNDSGEENCIPAYCCDHDTTPYQQNFFGKNKSLATLWAAVQTELLTYRRIAEGDPWISANFDMQSVFESLEKGKELSIRLVSEGMMKPFCSCGIFCNSEDPACLRVEEACASYFSNLEDWSRTTYLHAFEERTSIWDPDF
ncbi:hypothetical protein F5882DRAFT_297741 [Hyaloscypha sp. PMI_1271]|nr:hypothetical protein F5882DRAFT_297741 [Hyaloscypha sp. PMI_1271]